MKASDLYRIISFLFSNANHSATSPKLHRGIQVILKAKAVTMIALCDGRTITVEMEPQGVHGGHGSFFMGFDDLLTLQAPLSSSGDLRVRFDVGEQPLVKGVKCLRTVIGDWFEGSLGSAVVGPKRTLVKKGVTPERVQRESNLLNTICSRKGVTTFDILGGTCIRVMYPPAGVKSIQVELY